jgi:hypothetical protein
MSIRKGEQDPKNVQPSSGGHLCLNPAVFGVIDDNKLHQLTSDVWPGKLAFEYVPNMLDGPLRVGNHTLMFTKDSNTNLVPADMKIVLERSDGSSGVFPTARMEMMITRTIPITKVNDTFIFIPNDLLEYLKLCKITQQALDRIKGFLDERGVYTPQIANLRAQISASAKQQASEDMVEYKEPPNAKAMNRTYIGETLFETIRFMENQWKFGFIPLVRSDSQKLIIACGCLFEQFAKSLAPKCVLAFRIASMFAQTNQLVANSDRVADSVEVMQKDVSAISESVVSMAAQAKEMKTEYREREERLYIREKETKFENKTALKDMEKRSDKREEEMKAQQKEMQARFDSQIAICNKEIEELRKKLDAANRQNAKMRLDWTKERGAKSREPHLTPVPRQNRIPLRGAQHSQHQQQRRSQHPPPPPPRRFGDDYHHHESRNNSWHTQPGRSSRKRNRQN